MRLTVLLFPLDGWDAVEAGVQPVVLYERPDLVATAAVHEPPLFGLLEGTADQALASELSFGVDADAVVRDLISSGKHRDAAEYFIEHVALGPGTWDRLPEAFRAVLEHNAPTYLDELADETAGLFDAAALANTTVPLLLTHGTESPELFRAVIAEIAQLVPAARVEVLEGAGHIPHVTHPQDWVAGLVAFHDHRRTRVRGPRS
jgi:pimeloyl-ACP methyl ester carboxylesterase